MTSAAVSDADGEIFSALYLGLRQWAAVVAPNEIDPDDLVQEALTRTLAAKSLADLKDPSAYLRVVIVRLASNERRRLGRARRASARDAPVNGSTSPSYPSDLSDLEALEPEDRVLLYLTEVEGCSLREASEVFHRSQAALKMRRHRALRKIRTLLDQEDGEHA